MTSRRYLYACTLALVGVVLPRADLTAADQKWVPGKRFVSSATRVMGPIQKLTKDTNYGYCEGICLLAAFLTDKEEVTFNRWFDKGKQVAILGGGDDGVQDLDIVITDKAGKRVAADVMDDPSPVVEFTPSETASYSITVKMAKSGKNGGFATVGILVRGGYSVPVENLAAALTNLILQCEDINNKTRRDVSFTCGNNQWCVFGSIVAMGGDLTVEKLTPGGGDRVLIAGGDRTTTDIDLALLNSKGGVIKEDTDEDAIPRIVFQSQRNTNYGFKVKNMKSRGASLILTGMLTIED